MPRIFSAADINPMIFFKITGFAILPVLIMLPGCLGVGQTPGQNSEAKAPNSSEFHLSPAAVAAGIDGKLSIGLTINADGTASGLRIYGGPMWPCGDSTPNSQMEEVRKEVRKHVLAMKFSPEIKDGKPRSVSAEITFMLSERFKGAAITPGRVYRSGDGPGLVDVGQINGRAEFLPRPFFAGRQRGATLLQILVDESGDVTSAGGFKGDPNLITAARDAACKAKFKPATADGKPVRMTGILTYIFR